jgi:hypothetical protein
MEYWERLSIQFCCCYELPFDCSPCSSPLNITAFNDNAQFDSTQLNRSPSIHFYN